MAQDVTIGNDGSLFVGEDKTLKLEVVDASGVPVNIAGWNILFDVRLLNTSADPALLSKTASITGVYNVDRTLNTQRAIVNLTDTEMNTFKAKTYRHSWKRMDDGSETVLAYGNFSPQKATAP